jgi:hypothetical protein
MGLAVDDAGDVFIADWSNSIIRKVDRNGIITTVAGNPFTGTGLGDGGPATFAGHLNRPRGVAVDSNGAIYIADTDNHRVRKVDGGVLSTVAGTGVAGLTDTQLNFPYAVAVDNLGNIFIADTNNGELRGVMVAPRTYRLTLTSAGTGSGSLGGGAAYTVGQLAAVTAVASANSTFDGWSGPNAAECASGTVLMNGDKSCIATFTQQAVCAADVTLSVSVARSGFSYNVITKRYGQTLTLTNTGTAAIAGPLFVVLDNVTSAATLLSPAGRTACLAPLGSPYVTIAGGLAPGAHATVSVQFTDPANAPISYAVRVLAGSAGQP